MARRRASGWSKWWRSTGAASAHVLSNADMGYSYRHASAPDDFIFVEAVYEGVAEDRETIRAAMDAVRSTASGAAGEEPHRRLDLQEPRPAGTPNQRSAWRLIDAAGCRGLKIGDAQVSEMHCNFLINTGAATRSRPGAARRDGAGAGAGEFRRAARMGDQADRAVRGDGRVWSRSSGEGRSRRVGKAQLAHRFGNVQQFVHTMQAPWPASARHDAMIREMAPIGGLMLRTVRIASADR